jgi:long-chain acyl-CoA synthetase
VLGLEEEGSSDERPFLKADGIFYSYSQVFEYGDRIFAGCSRSLCIIFCKKDLATVAAYIGCLRANIVPMLIDADAKEVWKTRLVEEYNPQFLFGGKDLVDAHPNYEEKAHFKESILLVSRVRPQTKLHPDLALLLPTSGSTGDPKCVRFSKKNIEVCTRSICEYLNLEEHSVSISLLPIHYSYGLSVLHNSIFKRAQYVISDLSVVDRELWQLIESERVTDISGVPFTFEALSRIKPRNNQLNSVRRMTQAGGFLRESITRKMLTLCETHGIRYYTMYGQTEASPRIAYLAPEHAEEKKGTVGVAISCGEALIAETGMRSGKGELCYRGENVALGYAFCAKDLEKGDEFMGTLMTGDIVEIDPDGFITIVGRKKRMIKISGITFSLDQIERELALQGITCAAIGVDEKLTLVAECADAEQLRLLVMREFGLGRRQVTTAKVKVLPKNGSGKIDYQSLSEAYLR